MNDSNTDGEVNPKKLFVGNLPYSVTQDQLNDLFAEHGELKEVKLIINKMNGLSRGIGFVEFVEEDAAKAAIEAKNGFEIDGRAMIVNVARPFQKRDNAGGFGGRRDSGFSRGGGGYQGGRGGGGGDRGGYRGGSRGGYGGRDNQGGGRDSYSE